MQCFGIVQTDDWELRRQEFRVPSEVGAGEALLKVEATGMCGSDYEQFSGELARLDLFEYPVVPGHEPVGTIAQIGPDAEETWGVEVGDRVAVEPLVPCAVCPHCTQGAYNLCSNRFLYGYTNIDVDPGLWGGYAQYMKLLPNSIVHMIPESLSPSEAVLFNPLGAGLEWGIRAAGVEIGDTVLILGPGQRGLMSVVAAVEAGAPCVIVTGLSQDAHKLEIAKQFGATETINAEEENVVERVTDITGGWMADRVIDLTPYATQPVRDAVEAVRPGGTIVIAGLKGKATIDNFDTDRLIMKDATLRGVFGVKSWAYDQAIRLLESGSYPFSMMDSHVLTLDEVERGMRLLSGEYPDEKAVHVTILVDESGS